MRLRTKFSLLTCSVSLIAVTGASVLLYMGEKNLLLKELSEARSGLSEGLARVGRESLISSSQIQLVNYIAGISTDDTVLYAAVTDPEGNVAAHTDIEMFGSKIMIHGDRERPSPVSLNISENGKNLLLTQTPIFIGGSLRGYASAAFSMDKIEAIISGALEESRKRILGVAGIGVLIGLLGALIFSSMMVKPIKKMAEGAEKIGSGKLDTVISVREKDELGSLAGSLNAMAGRLSELDRMKQDFVSGITHEFRSPLNAMGIHFDLLIKGRLGELSEKQKDSIQVLQKNAKRLEKFINALLDVAKLERGKMEVIPENFRLKELIEDVTALYSVHADRKKILLSFETSGDEKVFADPDRTRQIITNLLSNAIKFTPEGGRVSISTAAEGAQVSVRIKDSGMGIPEDQLASIFDKFEQVKGIRQQIKGQKGTGLGLAIVKGLVEQQGGRIWVESEPDRGSLFTFTLPAEKND